jgi:queuine tRNA-ribosyltransferase
VTHFKTIATDGAARVGRLETAHGVIETPAFMVVGTLGAAKGLTPQQLREHGAQILLMNALHLAWRPGEEVVRELGGLHRFSGWDGPVLTDSGGYQIFSLPGLRQVSDEGAAFASPVNGDVRLFSPEYVIELQHALGADIIMALDQCPAHACRPEDLTTAVERSLRWAERGLRRHEELAALGRGAPSLFGIVQGGCDEELRRRSLEGACRLDFAGFALGGFCVGEPPEATQAGVVFAAPRLPADKPRYLMGMGAPPDILAAVGYGIDLFDCTLPTRNGRNATAFTSRGPLRLRNARFARDARPLDEACACYACRHFSRGCLRHLFLAREMNAAILTSLHNVAFYLKLMRDVRNAIQGRRYVAFGKAFLEAYSSDAWGTNGTEVLSDKC